MMIGIDDVAFGILYFYLKLSTFLEFVNPEWLSSPWGDTWE